MRNKKKENVKWLKIAARYTPKGIRVRWRRDNKLKPAHADLKRAEMLVPRLISLEALAFYIHECGHFHLKHFTKEEALGCPILELLYTGRAKKTFAEQEFEAEQYTITTMRKEGLVVSQELLGEMKRYIGEALEEDTINNKSPDFVRKWIR